jgi:hypothetical protein
VGVAPTQSWPRREICIEHFDSIFKSILTYVPKQITGVVRMVGGCACDTRGTAIFGQYGSL